jgi:hypothetical protein
MPNKAYISGILSIISGIIGVLWLGYAILMYYFMNAMLRSNAFSDYQNQSLMFNQFMQLIYLGWGIGAAIFGIIAIIGGIYALKKKHWGMALAGAIAGTIACPACGIPSIILISWAQNEFIAPSVSDTKKLPV